VASDTDAVQLLEDVPLTDVEAGYVDAARAANTMRGYRSDWREFTAWCTGRGVPPLPAAPATVTGYLTDLAHAGAKVGTMSRRMSALKFAHQLRNLPDPTRNARVVAVWEGVRRTHGAPPEQSAPLMPPELFDVVEACPPTKVWKTKGRVAQPNPTWPGPATAPCCWWASSPPCAAVSSRRCRSRTSRSTPTVWS